MPFTFEAQQAANWCWAACLRMASSNFEVVAPPQCTLANQFISGAAGCCSAPMPMACDQGIPDARVPALYAAASLIADPLLSGAGPITSAMIDMAVANGLALLMLDVGSGFHFVLVVATTASGYVVADPNPSFEETFTCGWSDLSTAYGNGSIANAWRVHKRT